MKFRPVVHYKGKPIGWPGWGYPHKDYICSFADLGAILDDPSATQEQKDTAQGEIEMAMDDFS